MIYDGLAQFLDRGKAALAKGPVALIFVEDLIEVETTIRHHQLAGFRETVVFAPPELRLPALMEDGVHRVKYNVSGEAAVETAVNAVIDAAPGIWLFYCYNAEYLFYPFCETRNVRELIAFHAEERRDALLTYVVDLYASDLDTFPDAVSLEQAQLDKSGYYALARPDEANHNHPKERQLDFFGGLRWRFEEHVPPNRRKIDRISMFRATKGLILRDDHTLNVEEYNTYACPWHNNVTMSLCSFRTAKALKTNPGSKYDIHSFQWHNSIRFNWHSQQLLDLGLMEPGQWF
jgi:hypothetical protein